MNPLHAIDFYKSGHGRQYPEDTELVLSNLTARFSRIPEIDYTVLFGLQYFCKEYLISRWNDDFFDRPLGVVEEAYKRRMRNAGINIDTRHIGDLHEVGHLPIDIMAVPEGTRVPIRVPSLVMWNNRPDQFWLTNYLETCLSFVLWGPCTSATTADWYRRTLDAHIASCGGDADFVAFQGHDFSCRGMFGGEAGELSGAAHLLSFNGTDTVAAIDFLEQYYYADSDKEFVGGSVPATEHSVMCMGGKDDEIGTFRRLINEIHPDGVIAIVCDTWDYWRTLTEYAPALRDDIMSRDGCVTFRPDSGDPVKIICGDPDAPAGSPEQRGSWQILWDTFGGTINEAGYKVLDSHVNLIYGDSITRQRCDEICSRLISAGFVPKCIFGIGSYTYQYVTRDTFGFAVKATYGVVNGSPREIFKDPVTDSGVKKSARGITAVTKDLKLVDQAEWGDLYTGALEPVFRNSTLQRHETLAGIRRRLRA